MRFGVSAICRLPAFQGNAADIAALLFYLLRALEPTRRWQSSPLKLDLGVSYSVAPYSSHSHPPCPMLYACTGHEGWELN